MIGLYLRLEPQNETSEDYYNQLYKFQVEIAGEKIPYVFCPQNKLTQLNGQTKLGFQEEGRIFISKKLKPAQVPFVALRLYHQGLDLEKLEEKFGKNTLAGLTSSERETLILGASLSYAREYLRPEDMADLIAKFKEEQGYNPRVHDPIFKDLITASTSKDQNALIKTQQQSLDFYIERTEKYIQAHELNKYVKRSKHYENLMATHPELSRIYSDSIIRADPIVKDILNDESLEDQLPSLIAFLDQLIPLPKGQVITVGPLESRLLYLCSDESITGRPPITFISGGEKDSNNYKISSGSAIFFESLKKRLQREVIQETKKAERAIAGIGQIITKIGSQETKIMPYVQRILGVLSPNKDLPTTTQALIVYKEDPIKTLTDLKEVLQERRTELGLTLTSASPEYLQINKALRAKSLLEQLKLPTTDLDRIIQEAQIKGEKSLQSVVGPTLLGR